MWPDTNEMIKYLLRTIAADHKSNHQIRAIWYPRLRTWTLWGKGGGTTGKESKEGKRGPCSDGFGLKGLAIMFGPEPSDLHSDVNCPGTSSKGDCDLRPAKQLQGNRIPVSQGL